MASLQNTSFAAEIHPPASKRLISAANIDHFEAMVRYPDASPCVIHQHLMAKMAWFSAFYSDLCAVGGDRWCRLNGGIFQKVEQYLALSTAG